MCGAPGKRMWCRIIVYGTENASLTHEETAQDDTKLPIMFDFPITRNLTQPVPNHMENTPFNVYRHCFTF